MRQVIRFLLSGFLILMVVNASAQVDSAEVGKRQRELEKNEKELKNIQGKIDKKDRKMRRAMRRAERKERKKEKHERRLRAVERKREKLATDTSGAYLDRKQYRLSLGDTAIGRIVITPQVSHGSADERSLKGLPVSA